MNRSLEDDRTARQQPPPPALRSLGSKFRSAFRGLGRGIRLERNFRVHGFAAAAVVAAGWWFGVSTLESCLLALCIAGVWAAEMFNTAVETLARAITRDYHREVEDALDTSSAAVLLVTCGAVIVGMIIFGRRLGVIVGWW